MGEPFRVAQITGKVKNGGVEAVVTNYYRHIDRTKVQFDFFVDGDFTDDVFRFSPLKDVEKYGGRIFVIPPYERLDKYIPELIRLFRRERYQIVHSHINTLSVFPLYAAKKAGVPIRIAHNHSTAVRGEYAKNAMKYCLRPFAGVYATHYAACSAHAGEWLFGKRNMELGKVTVFNNAIDLNRFRYDGGIRTETRKTLGLDGCFVIGNVGRFCYQKNQEFLLKVFSEVCERKEKTVLLFIGDGNDRRRIEEEAKKLRQGRIVFLGNRDDVEKLYPAMDVFVFPSRYEGLGMAAVEAQMCGVKAVISQAVPLDAKITSATQVVDLSEGAAAWADAIVAPYVREEVSRQARDQYDIMKQAGKMVDYYNKALKSGGGMASK